MPSFEEKRGETLKYIMHHGYLKFYNLSKQNPNLANKRGISHAWEVKKKKKGSPQLVLKFHCGCQLKFESLESAWKHVNESGDTVTFTGALFMGSSNTKCNELPIPNFPGLEIQFSCGDGFTSSFYEKAVEHVRKTGHVLQVLGRIKKQAPARKREKVAEHPTGKVPRPSKPMWRLEGQRGAREKVRG